MTIDPTVRAAWFGFAAAVAIAGCAAADSSPVTRANGGSTSAGGNAGQGGTAPAGGSGGAGLAGGSSGGAAGNAGVSGASGGAAGNAGVSGASGTAGVAGASGAAGNGGASGASGAAGSGGAGGASGAGGSGGTGGTPPTGPLKLDWQLDANAGPTACPTLTAITHPNTPTARWGTLTNAPKPTNKWWIGIALARDAKYQPPPYDVLVPQPYHVNPANEGLKVGFPHGAQKDTWTYSSDVSQWITLGASGASSWTIKEYDDQSVTLNWTATGGSMYAPLVTGMAYGTMVYAGTTPVISGITLNGTGKRFEGMVGAEKWVVYTSQDVTWSNGTASAPLNGWVRVAMVPDATAAAVLDTYAAAIPKRAKVDFGTAAGNIGVIQITWDTEGSGDPLMMALPHHIPRLADQSALKPVIMKTVVGDSQGVSGQLWQIAYQLTDVSFRPPRAIDPARLAAVKSALSGDAGFNPAANSGVYGSGKDLGKLARLAIIADEVGDTANRDTLLGRLKSKVGAWLDATNSGDKLNYDKTWGGVVSQCITGGNFNCDYGQGNYNDHHFHYGYLVYAAAVAAKLDPAWATQYKEKGTWLVRDYANPYRNDPCFTRLRQFDAHAGHSWAMGLWSSWNYGEGRNQESSSESINGYYGMQLWGEATGNTDIAKVGKILRIAESVGAMTYYQVRNPSKMYGPPVTDGPCVGYLWGSLACHGVFFQAGPETICGIQMIPVTPASEDFLGKDWVAENWDSRLAPIATSTWRSLFMAALSNWDKAKGCAGIDQLTSYESGNSKTNMLHYCATRP